MLIQPRSSFIINIIVLPLRLVLRCFQKVPSHRQIPKGLQRKLLPETIDKMTHYILHYEPYNKFDNDDDDVDVVMMMIMMMMMMMMMMRRRRRRRRRRGGDGDNEC